jgi:hypothetical protein
MDCATYGQFQSCDHSGSLGRRSGLNLVAQKTGAATSSAGPCVSSGTRTRLAGGLKPAQMARAKKPGSSYWGVDRALGLGGCLTSNRCSVGRCRALCFSKGARAQFQKGPAGMERRQHPPLRQGTFHETRTERYCRKRATFFRWVVKLQLFWRRGQRGVPRTSIEPRPDALARGGR